MITSNNTQEKCRNWCITSKIQNTTQYMKLRWTTLFQIIHPRIWMFEIINLKLRLIT